MKKELKDYLHFYIGAPIKCTNENCSSDMEYFGMQRVVSHLLFDKYLNGNWKPLLRNLSDMTEEEMLECGNMIYDFSNDPDLNKWQPSDFEIGLAPEQFLWLLSKHFDLFGLIESGLAIDATTLKH